MTKSFKASALLPFVLASVVACNPEQRDTVDSAAGAAEAAVRTALSVIDVDMGRRVDDEKKIADKTDVFAPTDTIFASVHTSGTAERGAVVARWTFPDGSVVEDASESAASDGDAYSTFFIAKPGGLAKGKYTFNVVVDGREVRSKDVTVE